MLDHVLPNYLYSSLPELNAVLQQYNIVADRGSKDSRIYKNNGLVYRVLNEKGQKIGVPIPASHIYSKPTLTFLETKFTANEPLKQRHKLRVKNAIDMAFFRHPNPSLDELMAALRREKISLVPRKNESGLLYGITYVDMEKKCVFNGSELGKSYSANEIRKRCTENLVPQTVQQQQRKLTSKQQRSVQTSQTGVAGSAQKQTKQPSIATVTDGQTKLFPLQALPQLTTPDTASTPTTLPVELMMDLKKKRRKKQKH